MVEEHNGRVRRALGESDLRRMRLPERFWNATMEGVRIEGDNREKIIRYIDHLPDAMDRGLGLMLWGPNGRGKCIVPETVVSVDGRLMRIGDVYQGPLVHVPLSCSVMSYGGSRRKATAWYDDGDRDTVAVELCNGQRFVGTQDHPVVVSVDGVDREVPLSRVRVGDLAVVDLGCRVDDGDLVALPWGSVDVPGVLDVEVARMLGWVVAEGRSRGRSVSFTNSNKRALSFVSDVLQRRFTGHFNKPFSRGDTVTIDYSGPGVGSWFERMGCGGGSAHKRISPDLLGSPRRVLASFLRSLFGGDGGVCERSVEYTSKSEELVRDLQRILYAFGVCSKISSGLKCATNGTRVMRRYWRLVIRGADVAVFASEVGFDECELEKNAALSALVERVESSSVDSDSIPISKDRLRRLLSACCEALGTGKGHGRGAAKRRGGLKSVLGAKLDNLVRAGVCNGRVSRTALRRLLEAGRELAPVEAECFVDLCRSDRRYVEVRSVGAFGRKRVLDLIVDGDHLFWSDGLISHNTGIAALVAKEAARWGYGCMFIRAADLVDRQFGRAVFDKDDGITVRERARTVSLLVLDDLGKEHRDQHGFTVAEMEEFIRERISRRLVTEITTNMLPKSMADVYKPSMLEVMKEAVHPLKCDGPDLRDEKRAEVEGFLGDAGVGAGDA
jgi:hypothetical protein